MADGILDSLVLVQVTMNITLFKGVEWLEPIGELPGLLSRKCLSP